MKAKETLLIFLFLIFLFSACVKSGTLKLPEEKKAVEKAAEKITLPFTEENSVAGFSISKSIGDEWRISSEEGMLEEVLILEKYPSVKLIWRAYNDPYKIKFSEAIMQGKASNLNLSLDIDAESIEIKEVESGNYYAIVAHVKTYTFVLETKDIASLNHVLGDHKEVFSEVFKNALESFPEL